MDAEDIVLGVVGAAGGEITCRTYLQKVAYFVSEMMGIPMGFEPHYYGPYSSSITAETDSHRGPQSSLSICAWAITRARTIATV